ncbi:hypothetical protein V1503_24415 [Bacillus sp. SCS-151]|uniref:hypothetical protein n=1 Tax=Nanhaiella sioensis TaxID=3115293 RepID=UPI00397DCF1C
MINELKEEVEQLIGQEVYTLYGESTVEGLIKVDGIWYVHLKEFSEEDYHVKLVNWHQFMV